MKENVATANLSTIDEYLNEMTAIIGRIDRAQVDRAIEMLYQTWLLDRKVFILGNGGSASTATHFACDLTKTTIVPGEKRFKVISLVDNIPLVSALTNDEGFEKIYDEQLDALLEADDVVVALSVHGGSGKGNASAWSQNILRAIELAKARGAKSMGFAGFDGGAMKTMADTCVIVPCDSTPHAESLHLALEHLICSRLHDLIKESRESGLSR
ncbi:MAG: SIS domain-containing protein [Actinobacteria bacterium]|nr:SIS domain-containing protein [Actinomycetota bacterium]